MTHLYSTANLASQSDASAETTVPATIAPTITYPFRPPSVSPVPAALPPEQQLPQHALLPCTIQLVSISIATDWLGTDGPFAIDAL
jgi:hypothetical protein